LIVISLGHSASLPETAPALRSRVRFRIRGRTIGRDPQAGPGAAREALGALAVPAASGLFLAERAACRGDHGAQDACGGQPERHAASTPDGARAGKRGAMLACVVRAPCIAAALLAAASSCAGSSVGSIGAMLGRDNETRALYVRDVPPGMAADQAGLLPGDEILMIDGIYARDLTAKDVRARLRGEIGSAVELTVVRGGEVRNVRVTRGELRERQEIAPREERIDP
jgi:carboxyl-terminal processing protease